MNIIVPVFWWPFVFISLVNLSRSGISMSKGKLMFSLVDTAKQSSNWEFQLLQSLPIFDIDSHFNFSHFCVYVMFQGFRGNFWLWIFTWSLTLSFSCSDLASCFAIFVSGPGHPFWCYSFLQYHSDFIFITLFLHTKNFSYMDILQK